MHQQALSSFPLPATETQQWDKYSERFAVGQIIARFALGLRPRDHCPHPTERESLMLADLTSCRANLFRLIAMSLMSPIRESRPSFSRCRHDISTWKTDKFHHFITRFYDFYNSNNTRRDEALMYIDIYSDELLRGEVNWMNPQFLSHEAYHSLIKSGRHQELKKEAYANYRRHHLPHAQYRASGRQPGEIFLENVVTGEIVRDDILVPDALVAANMTDNGTAVSIFTVYRNKAAHFFDFCRDVGMTHALSEDYCSFWCSRFPMLVTVAWLVANKTKLYEIDSFAEFFSCSETIFYISIAKQDSLGLTFQEMN